jgi:hypothetical protein
MDMLRSQRSWLETSATWIAIVGALCGGAFAVYRFVGNLEASRAKEALAYAAHFSDAPVAASYSHFVQYFAAFLAERDKNAPLTDQAMTVAIDNPTVEADTIVVIHFFDNAAACTCKHLCDEQLVRLFLGWQAKDFYDVTRSYIRDKRIKQVSPRSLGAGLEALAAAQGHPSATMNCSFVAPSVI